MVLIGGNVMKTCTQEITLYVDRKNKYKYVYGKQSDTKSRFLKVTIVDGGKKVMLGSDDNAKFRALKPDGTAVFNDCVIEPDGTILVELSAQTLAVAGQVSADVVIIGKSDEILATANFCIIVEKAPVGKDVESSNEFLALVEAMNQSVKKDQGKENSGKVLAVGDDGIVVPAEIKVGDNSLVVSATINDDYQVVSCDTTFDDVDKAYAAGSSMLMKASIADSSITVIAPFMQKTDSNDYIFAFDDGSVIHAIAIGESGTWTTTDVQIDANKIPYELSEDFLANFPDFELESDTVKSGLDFAMYYAVAGMFAKYIGCDVQSGSGDTVSVDLQRILDNFVFPAMKKAHTHNNESVLDKFAESDGKPTYDGEALSGSGAGDFIIKMTVTFDGNGKYTVTSCSTTVEQIDAAVAAEKRIVVIATDMENGVFWEMPIVEGHQGENYYFATFIVGTIAVSFVEKISENQARWQFVQPYIESDIVGYSNDTLPDISTVREALDHIVAKSNISAYYIDLTGKYPNYTCPVTMDDIKTAYNSGYNLVCRCTMGKYTATLPLFVPMPSANTWIFSGSGCLQSMGFPAQSFTVAITGDGVKAQNKELATSDGTLRNPYELQITVGNTPYLYDGSERVNIVIDDGTEVSY